MQATKRYLLVVLVFLSLVWLLIFSTRRDVVVAGAPKAYVVSEADEVPRLSSESSARPGENRSCRMNTCFDLERCRRLGFFVYVYPPGSEGPSQSYAKLLAALRDANYVTEDPERACVFVLSVDTLDRDNLSGDYVHNLGQAIVGHPLWNGGQNHVIFNLYSGTWPVYSNSLGFDPGRAILAKASMGSASFRPGFDVALPLFSKGHPAKGSQGPSRFPSGSRYLLVFKGKRYLHGIGSDTRNALYHLHNGKDVVLLTTCRHGKKWREMKDVRCEKDELEYKRYDYRELMENSTYCLVPRGRRLGSFRFLEALQAGCIPVLLSNGWELPFSEVVDWKQAAIWADERTLLQVPEMLRSIPKKKVHTMRQHTQILWDTYFSSIDKIVLTTMEIIRERIFSRVARQGTIWNTWPGALAVLPEFSSSLRDFPFYLGSSQPRSKFSAVIYCTLPAGPHLYKLIRNVAASKFISRIFIIWASDQPTPSKFPTTSVPINVVHPKAKTISSRFTSSPLIETDAIFSLDEDVTLVTEEIDFAFKVWLSFPERIVGYPARSHYWEEARGQWAYTSKWTNEFSMVLTGAAVYHRYYHFLYEHWLTQLPRELVDRTHNCEDLLLNFLVSHVTHLPPLKLTQRKRYKELAKGFPSRWSDHDHFSQRQVCLNTFVGAFGYMPLVRSSSRLEPVFYKDSVSALRKRYRKLELVATKKR